jgi:uncharacterized repeat protein (TIGR04076 family)
MPMHKLTVSVSKILGTCSSTPPMRKGDYFTVEDGDIRLPANGFVCIWALQSILPLLPAKERKVCERRAEDWMWRVHHVQCPDPAGRVVFRIGRGGAGKPAAIRAKDETETGGGAEVGGPDVTEGGASVGDRGPGGPASAASAERPAVRPLRIVVDAVRGTCTLGMRKGDAFFIDGCRLTLPLGGHVCLYALQAVLPFVAAKARRLEDGDWLERENRFICPDPAGNVILRIE